MSKISVIVPVYNVAKYLRRCVESVLVQKFTDFELILIDDGSTDGSGNLCDELARLDSRIIVLHKVNGGLSSARNFGMDWCDKNSVSEWVFFLDSDDWIHSECLSRLFAGVKEHNVDISVCGFKKAADSAIEGKLDKSQTLMKVEDFWVKKNLNAVVAWGKLYRRTLFRDVRYPVGKLHEDEFTTYKLLFKKDLIVYDSSELYYYYIRADSITTSEWRPRRLDSLEAIDEQIAYFDAHGYRDAISRSLINKIGTLAWHIQAIGSIEKYRNEKSRLRIELKKQLEENAISNNVNPLDFPFPYFIAYPVVYNKLTWPLFKAGLLSYYLLRPNKRMVVAV